MKKNKEYVKIFSDALLNIKSGYHNGLRDVILNSDQVIIKISTSQSKLSDYGDVMNFSSQLMNRVYHVHGEFVMFELVDINFEEYQLTIITKKIKFDTNFNKLPMDVFMNILQKVNFNDIDNFVKGSGIVISDKNWEVLMMRRFSDYYRDLKDIRYRVTWKDIYHNCLDLNVDLYDKSAQTAYMYRSGDDIHGYDISHGLLHAIVVKTHDGSLFRYIASLSIYDLNWVGIHNKINYGNYAYKKDLGDVIESRDTSQILGLSRNDPIVSYIMICALSGHNPDVLSDFGEINRTEDNIKLVTHGPILLNYIYLYKRELINKISVDTLKNIYDNSDFKDYPILRKYISKLLTQN